MLSLNNKLHSVTESRIKLVEKYVQFLESADKIQSDLDALEKLLRETPSEDCGQIIEETWASIRGMIHDLTDMGNAFIKDAHKVAILNLTRILQQFRCCSTLISVVPELLRYHCVHIKQRDITFFVCKTRQRFIILLSPG